MRSWTSSLLLAAIVCLTNSLFIGAACEARQETKLEYSDGSPATDVVVFSIDEKDRPLLMINEGVEFRPHPMGRNGKPMIGFQSGADSQRADEKGRVKINRKEKAHLIVAQSGDEMAFVPRGTSGTVRLRKCGRLKMDFSRTAMVVGHERAESSKENNLLRDSKPTQKSSLQAIEEDIKKVTVIAHWKNSLAGIYAQTEGTEDDYRLNKWFDIQFVFPEATSEITLPPGEVSIGLLTQNQVDEMSKFNFETSETLFNRTLRGICCTAGIHSIESGKRTQPRAIFGAIVSGNIKERSDFPRWERSKIFDEAKLDASLVEFISPDFSKGSEGYIKWLLSHEGKRYRTLVTNQAVWLKTDGSFLAPPYSTSEYRINFFPSISNQPMEYRVNGMNVGWRLVDDENESVTFKVPVMYGFKPEWIKLGTVFLDDPRTERTELVGTPSESVVTKAKKKFDKTEETVYEPANERTATAKTDSGEFNEANLAREDEQLRREIQTKIESVGEGGELDVETIKLEVRKALMEKLKAQIDTRNRQLDELDSRITAARVRLTERENQLNQIVEQQLQSIVAPLLNSPKKVPATIE